MVVDRKGWKLASWPNLILDTLLTRSEERRQYSYEPQKASLKLVLAFISSGVATPGSTRAQAQAKLACALVIMHSVTIYFFAVIR